MASIRVRVLVTSRATDRQLLRSEVHNHIWSIPPHSQLRLKVLRTRLGLNLTMRLGLSRVGVDLHILQAQPNIVESVLVETDLFVAYYKCEVCASLSCWMKGIVYSSCKVLGGVIIS